MEYFSGLSEALRITFVQIMIMGTIAIAVFLYGMIINFQKWGSGVTGYGLEPKEGEKGSAIRFLKTWWHQVTEVSHAPHAKPLLEVLILDILFQRKILKRSPLRWIMHFSIFAGWITLFSLSGMMFAVEMTERLGIYLPFTSAEFRDFLSLPNYVFGYILLIGVIIAVIRRLFITEVREASIMYDWILLIGLLIVTISGFIADGIRTGLIWSFGIAPESAPPAALFHCVISLLFCVPGVPFTKYIHMISTPLVILANQNCADEIRKPQGISAPELWRLYLLKVKSLSISNKIEMSLYTLANSSIHLRFFQHKNHLPKDKNVGSSTINE